MDKPKPAEDKLKDKTTLKPQHTPGQVIDLGHYKRAPVTLCELVGVELNSNDDRVINETWIAYSRSEDVYIEARYISCIEDDGSIQAGDRPWICTSCDITGKLELTMPSRDFGPDLEKWADEER